MKQKVLTILFAVVLVTICACQKKDVQSPAAKKLRVVTTLFPLYDFARTVGGDKVDVTLLLPPGVEPHSFDPKPEDVMKVGKADLFVFTNEYMEPWALKFVEGVGSKTVTVVDASKGARFLTAGTEEEHGGEHDPREEGHHHAGGVDPHLWLDFANAQIMVGNIAAAMGAKDPANKDFYAAKAVAYKAELQQLDDEFKAGLAHCEKRLFMHGGHYAFGYLASRYGLKYQSAQAFNPDTEPTPAKMAALVKQMRANGLKYIYSEELLSPRTADVIARETGATILKLHGAHNISRDDLAGGATFISLMQKNLASLRTGLQCQ